MGRRDGFRFGLLGLLLPGFFLYMTDGTTTALFFQGFFYDFLYKRSPGGSETGYHWMTSTWLKSDFFRSPLAFYLYLAGFALVVLGLIVILGSARGGSFLLLLAGLANLGLMLLHYPVIEDLSGTLSIFPLPVGAAVLLLAAFIGLRD